MSRSLKKLTTDGTIILFITLVTLLGLEFGAKYVLNWQLAKLRSHHAKDFDAHLLPAYPGKTKEQIVELRSEMLVEEIYEPWLNIRMPDVKGRYLNTNGLLRKSAELPKTTSSPQKVYFFGGSTTFGINVADEETIPSHFQTIFNESGRSQGKKSVEVFNYGQPYYLSPQESISFYILLMKGHRPDVAIFTDGLNDTINKSSSYYRYPAYSDQVSNLFQMHRKYPNGVNPKSLILHEFYLPRLFALLTHPDSADLLTEAQPLNWGTPKYNASYADPDGVSDSDYEPAMIKNYFENIGMTKTLCRAFDIQCFFFWQPVPMYNYMNRKNDPICAQPPYPYVEHIYEKMRKLMKPSENEYFIADLVNDYKGEPFVDAAHYSSGMNRFIAEKMVQLIEPSLQNVSGK